MKLGVIHWGFPPRGGGVEAHLLTLLPEIVKMGHEVFVLTESDEEAASIKEVLGVKIFRHDELSAVKLECMRNIYDRCFTLFKKFIKENQIDIIQAHNLHMDYFDLSRSLLAVCAENKIPAYLVLHNHEFIDRDKKAMLAILEMLPWGKLVCMSRFIERKLKEEVRNVPVDRWKVIMHGVDLDKFKPASLDEKEKLKLEYGYLGRQVILHPARILHWKGIVPAIKAMPEVMNKFPNAILVLSGRVKPIYKSETEVENYNRFVDQTIEKLNLKNKVYFEKHCFSGISSLTALSEVVIYTTTGEEPFGLCPVEAMACAVPVVVTRSGGLVESVVDGETGFIIERDEDKIPALLKEKLLEILSNPLLAEKMGGAGRVRAEKLFDKKRMADDFIKLSEELQWSK